MMRTKLVDILRRWRFLILLASLIVGLILEPLIVGLRVHGRVFDLFYSLIILAAMGSLTGYRFQRYNVLALGVATLATTWIVHLFVGSAVAISLLVSESFSMVFLVVAVWAVVKAVTQQSKVNLDTVFGAIAGYLLLGLAWSDVFLMVHTINPDAFTCSERLQVYLQEGGARSSIFTYYSFVTLSTLGYGDVTPVSHAACTLAWAEAISGQFYIAVLVAGIVSVLVSSSQKSVIATADPPVTETERPVRE